MRYRLGVDVGGTFTDLLLIREDGWTARAKVPSVPANPADAIFAGVDKICGQTGVSPDEIDALLHGTTVATNAVLEGKGARVALITTEGFRYVLHIARSHIPGGLGGWITHKKPEALAPLELTIEAPERIDGNGEVVRPLDEAAVRARLATLAGQEVGAITIALFNAYVNGVHERRIREIVREMMPDVPVSISSEVLPELMEYERTQTTVVNSYVRPLVANYVDSLSRRIADRGMKAKLHILRSDGGLASAKGAADFPVQLLMSGPAGGVAGALWVARQAGFSNILTLDMGGTSTDVALAEGGAPRLRRETAVGDIIVRASCLDIQTVGAGGGSIAKVPELTRALRVGPESAGAVPGPAAYGRGGRSPTVSDANAVLGYLPEVRLGGEMRLDYDAAATAVGTIAAGLGLDLDRAAQGIIDIVNETMFGALRAVSVQQGYDPRDFALMAFGGAGPLHANALGRLMQSWPVIIPPAPGVLCAYGDATTHLRNEASRTWMRLFADADPSELAGQLADLADKASAMLEADGVARADQIIRYEIDCRYRGQGLTVTVPVTLDDIGEAGLPKVAAAFDAEHRKLFTFALDTGHEMVNLRAIVEAGTTPVEVLAIAAATSPDPSEAEITRCNLYVDGSRRDAPVYDRPKLKSGHVIVGPAIITEMDSTTLVLPDHVARVDGTGCLLITPIAS